MKTGSVTLSGGLIAIVLGSLFFLVIGEVGLRVMFPHWQDFYSGRFIETEWVDGRPGVAIGRPGFDGHFAQNNGDFRVAIRINDFGLRNPEPIAAADGRIWVIGDSMAFGWGVEQPEMYSSVIAKLSGAATYNVASPGADVCGYQALAARMPKSMAPKAVVVGLILENDIYDYNCQKIAQARQQTPSASQPQPVSLMNIKMALTQQSALYNFVAVSVKRAAPLVAGLKAIGLINPDHAYKLTFDGSRVGALAKSTAQELSNLKNMFREGTPFAVLIAPARFEIRDADPLYKQLRTDIATTLGVLGIDVIDPYLEFKEAGFRPTHFAHDGHWSALGHEIAGKAVAKWVSKILDR